MKRPDPTNASKIRRPVHVIESDSDDDNEIVVRDYHVSPLRKGVYWTL